MHSWEKENRKKKQYLITFNWENGPIDSRRNFDIKVRIGLLFFNNQLPTIIYSGNDLHSFYQIG